MTIRKLGPGRWRVYSRLSHRNMGTYDSLSAAKERLRLIEIFKRRKR